MTRTVGYGHLPYFQGPVYQRGHGLGSFFGGLFRAALPLLKQGAKTLGKQALQTGLQVAGDVIENKRPIKESFRSRLREAGSTLRSKAENKVAKIISGSGKRKRTQKKKTLVSRKKPKLDAVIKMGPPLAPPQLRKQKRARRTSDIFDHVVSKSR